MYRRIFLMSSMLAMIWVIPALARQSELVAQTPRIYLPLVVKPLAALTNLPARAATYIGGIGADEFNAAGIAADGTLLAAGALPAYAPGGVPVTTVPGATSGAVVRMSADGANMLSILRIGAVVRDLEVNETGQTSVCGDFGVARLNASATGTIWSATPGDVARCALGADGVTVALTGNTVAVYDANGALLHSWSVNGTAARDLVVDSARSRVIVGGYTQVSGSLQLPWLRAYTYTGAIEWISYDFASAPGLGADSRIERLAMGADGRLYVAGSINGGAGASVFARDPKNINLALGARLVKSDEYSDPFNMGSATISWFGRFNPVDGALDLAQSLLTRRTSDAKGNSVRIKAIAADDEGRVFLAGDAACCIKNRGQQQVGGIAVGPYEIGEGYLAMVTADFRLRVIWTPYSGPAVSGGGSAARALAVRNGQVLSVATLSLDPAKQRGLIGVNAFQAALAGPSGSEGYLLLWQAP